MEFVIVAMHCKVGILSHQKRTILAIVDENKRLTGWSSDMSLGRSQKIVIGSWSGY